MVWCVCGVVWCGVVWCGGVWGVRSVLASAANYVEIEEEKVSDECCVMYYGCVTDPGRGREREYV